MITYVNTVLVSNKTYSNAGDTLWAPSNGHAEPTSSDAGKFIIMTMDEDGGKVIDSTVVTPYLDASAAASAQTMRIGVITNKTVAKHNADGTTSQVPVIKWSAVIKRDAIKSYTYTAAPVNAAAAKVEDAVTIDLHELNASLLSEFAKGGKRIIVRLTFKDLPTRYRKWTESYEYVTKIGDGKGDIATAIANMINKDWKRARVSAVATTTSNQEKVVLTAMPYDDDESVDSLNWAAQGRFNVNVYYTDPAAEGWESKNKNFITGVTITKAPGKYAVGYGKLVRDREAQAMGYDGILNRGEGTWPIIKPEMQAQIDGLYAALTVEFENMYRTADDLQRKTKQTVEIYAQAAGEIKAVIDNFVTDSVELALANKVDKVAGTANNFVAFDTNGAIKDSGKKASDFSAA